MSKRVRRQHTVSKFYLKGFADDAGRIRRVSLPGSPAPVLSTGDASVVKDFYSVTLPDGSLSDFFEREFSKIEARAAETLKLILSGTWPTKGVSRSSLAAWIALQHLRAEQVRENQTSQNSEIIRLIVGISGKAALKSHIEKAERRGVTDEELDAEWRDLTKPGGPDLRADVNAHIALLASLLPGTAAYLSDSQWTLFKFSQRSIITSDHPVSLTVAPDYPAWRGIGIFTADIFLVPLSRRHALTIRPKNLREGKEIPDYSIQGTTKIAQTLNQQTTMGARRYLYHHPGELPLKGIHVPNPSTDNGRSMSNADDLIREEGLFHNLPNETLLALSHPNPAESRENGMSLDDLPWPIPGRRKPSAE